MQLLEIPEQTHSSEIDEEIIEIFVEEVDEVLQEIITNFKLWKENQTDSESLKTLRRSFHTLKGSGRLVGATVIGELGWRFENMLNRVFEGTLPSSNELFSLIEQVITVLPSLVEQFQHNQPTPKEVVILISQADSLTQKNKVNLDEFKHASDALPDVGTKPEPVLKQEQPDKENTNNLPANESENVTVPPFPANEPLNKNETEVLTEPLATGGLEMEANNFDNFAADGLFNLPEGETEQGDISFEGVELEIDNNFLDNELEGFLPSGELEVLDFSTLEQELEINAESLPGGDIVLETEAFSFENDNDNLSINVPSQDTSLTTESLETEEIDPLLFDIFKTEASEHISHLKNIIKNLEQNLQVGIDTEMVRAFHTLNGSSRSVDFSVISDIAAPMENYARTLLERKTEVTSNILAFFNEANHLIENLLEGKPVNEKQQKTLLDNVQISLESLSSTTPQTSPSPAPKSPPTTPPPVEESVPDATDEFLELFLEEAEEILEKTQSLLERWQSSPKNMQLMKELQRELHTLKGGARMVGIAQMGNLSHHLESVLTRIVDGTAQTNAKLQDIIQNSVDELAAMLEAVRSGVPLDMPTDLIEQINAAIDEEPADAIPVVSNKPKPKPKKDEADDYKPIDDGKDTEVDTDDRIRVRATLIDKLTNLAGELSISRAHIEQQQGSTKNNLEEMEQTVIRLRDQLRRLEIETEAQILSHFGGPTGVTDDGQEFDLLELDRFSVMQQLSRSLMESINDLADIQDVLNQLTRQSDSLLIQQSRIGAELQENIMRTRMIPFAKISPRLQRIARLTARELHKQVDFIINGENIEFERTVLNRIVAPLEHLLRNAIGHGVEDAPTRQQAGKSTIAKIAVDISREGAELIIKLSDDGAGLNLHAIRQKAEERGLIKPDTVISDYELMQCILEPGFSTAKTITQVSGRGVGMDVVSSEIKQLSASLQIHSKSGVGTTFEIRLPLSLTINQALLVHVGEETMAIPMNNVEAVMRASRAEMLGDADNVRYYKYIDNDYRVSYLGELLGFGQIASLDMSLIPTLLVRAGERRTALLVDGIEGSKEIVVKSIGPQIGAIRWITGATILGDGRVVLILDIPTLTRTEATPLLAPSQVSEIAEEEKPAAKTIMVVDDSITVRKVTARLLKRQGMEVITAKDGLDAITQLQDTIPDLMLLDVEMPRMDGYELATNVRNRPELKHLPIIMITSRTGTKHRDKAEKIGINRYLGKPFNETELIENINALLAETTFTKPH